MKIKILALMCAFLILSTTANAALFGRLAATEGGTDYQAYYDDEADLTWLADANYPLSSGYQYNDNGRMTWADANAWAASLTVDGVGGWRLPDTSKSDRNCSQRMGKGTFYGYNCTGSEMGNLFYNVLGNTIGSLTDRGPFSNIQLYLYWSASDWTYKGVTAGWSFSMSDGYQSLIHKEDTTYAWAVQSGDVSAVVPVVIPPQ